MRLARIGAATALLLATLAPVTAAEDDTPTGAGYLAIKGRITFERYCSGCHGKEARGDGPTAELLEVLPPDLTKIAQRADGAFEREAIEKVIDGRTEIKAHRRKDMPVWGDIFQDPLAQTPGTLEEEQKDRAHRMIAELVAFLETIQDPPPSKSPEPPEHQPGPEGR